MKKSFKLSIIGAVLSSVLFATSANASDEEVLALQRTILNLQNQVSDLEDKLANSEGQMESLNHDIEVLQKENSKLKQQLASANTNATADDNAQDVANNADAGSDKVAATNSIAITKVSGDGNATLTKSKIQSATPAKATPTAVGGLDMADASAQKMYNDAYALLSANKLDKAASAFNNYVTKYQNNSLTPNAWYWLGQVQFKQKKYNEARVSFLNTAKFKTAPKRADALYKLGVTSKVLGDKDKARKYFNLLIKTYPQSSSATLAKKELSAL